MAYPTYHDVKRWQTEERLALQPYQFLFPRDREQAILFFVKLGAKECFEMCSYANLKRDKHEIELRAEYACILAKRATKAQNFSNNDEELFGLGKDYYAKGYTRAQQIFELNFRLLESIKYDTEHFGWDIAYDRVKDNILRFVQYGK